MEGKRRGRGIGGIFAAILLIILLFASLYFTLSFLESYLKGVDIRSIASLDWAGYVVTSSYLNPQPVIIGVNGSWTVPQVTASQTDQFSAAWIGIGGQIDDNTLIQTGTEHDSINGTNVYSVWYELLPNDSIPITSIKVSPGDHIKASITLVDSTSNKWSIEIRDVTKAQRFQNNFIYNSSRLSAEWVIERPTVNNRITTLADFGTATFTDSYATVGTASETILDLPFLQVVMRDRQNNPLVTVSSLDSKGSGFTVSYISVASIQTCPVQVLEANIQTSVTGQNAKKVAEHRRLVFNRIT